MTGDQWFHLLKLALFLGFASLVLFGVYRLVKDADRKNDGDA